MIISTKDSLTIFNILFIIYIIIHNILHSVIVLKVYIHFIEFDQDPTNMTVMS